MKFLSYYSFVNEEKVSLNKDLREYTLTHLSEDKFHLESGEISTDFKVSPYKNETLKDLHEVHTSILSCIDSSHVNKLYSSIIKAQSIPYDYGNVFKSKFSLTDIPEFAVSLSSEQSNSLAQSESNFLLNNFSELGKSVRDDIIKALNERSELICCVIEALFYFIRRSDKTKFYEGLDQNEIVDEYEKIVKTSSKDASFSFSGPYDDINTEISPSSKTTIVFWKCEKDSKKFYIKASVSPKLLYDESMKNGIKGLKLSLISKTDEVSNAIEFNASDLTNEFKTYFKKLSSKK